MTASKFFRTLSVLIGHCLTALLTTAIIESGWYASTRPIPLVPSIEWKSL